MAEKLDALLANNQRWADAVTEQDPSFFSELAKGQSPEYLWLGCADSRVPACQVTGLKPGEMFVHRNIANVISHTDLNSQSVMQYAVEALKVKHIVVCGHYGCGGVAAAMGNGQLGLIDNWLRNIKDVYLRNKAEVMAITDETEKLNRLCELNVKAQVANVCHTTIVQDAWRRGQPLTVHGLIYNLADGRLKDLEVSVDSVDAIEGIYQVAP